MARVIVLKKIKGGDRIFVNHSILGKFCVRVNCVDEDEGGKYYVGNVEDTGHISNRELMKFRDEDILGRCEDE